MNSVGEFFIEADVVVPTKVAHRAQLYIILAELSRANGAKQLLVYFLSVSLSFYDEILINFLELALIIKKQKL